jgi:hypothetical protein
MSILTSVNWSVAVDLDEAGQRGPHIPPQHSPGSKITPSLKYSRRQRVCPGSRAPPSIAHAQACRRWRDTP